MSRETDAAESLSEGGSPEADRHLAENFGMTVRQVQEFDPQTLDVTRACKFLGLPPKRFDSLAGQPGARDRWVASVAREKKELIETFPHAGKELKEMLEAIRKFALRKCLKPDSPAMVNGVGRGAKESNRPRGAKTQLLVVGGALVAALLVGGTVIVLMSARGGPEKRATALAGDDTARPVLAGTGVTKVGPSSRNKRDDRVGADKKDDPAQEKNDPTRKKKEVTQKPGTPAMKVVLDVDFNKTSGGFPRGDNKSIRYGRASGQWRLVMKSYGLWWPSQPLHKIKASHFICEIDAQLTQPVMGGWGLRFGTHPDNLADLQVHSDGKVRLISDIDLDGLLQPTNLWETPAAARPAPESNRIRIEVAKTRIRLFINGRHAGDKTIERLRAGPMALYVYGRDVPVEARFNRIRVWVTNAEKH